jgi:hypothetical protein
VSILLNRLFLISINFFEIPGKQPIWEITNDYHMHNPLNYYQIQKNRSKSKWFSDLIWQHLPQSTSTENKIVKELIRVQTRELEMLDLYCTYYVSHQFTSFEETIAWQISHLANVYMPTFRTNFSPFEPGKRIGNQNAKNPNPSLTGKSPSGSTSGSSSSGDDTSSNSDEDIEIVRRSVVPMKSDQKQERMSLENTLPNSQNIYGFCYETLDPDQLQVYKNYAAIVRRSSPQYSVNHVHTAKGLRFDNERMEKTQPFNSVTLGKYENDIKIEVTAETKIAFQNYCDLVVSLNYDRKSPSESILKDYVNFVK